MIGKDDDSLARRHGATAIQERNAVDAKEMTLTCAG